MQGILFVEHLFRLVINGVKTETRRTGALDKLINKNPGIWGVANECVDEYLEFKFNNLFSSSEWISPRYRPGEIVFLKEPYTKEGLYKYDFTTAAPARDMAKWKNKMFMPHHMARYFIQIINVRVERIKDITSESAIKEGIYKNSLADRGYTHPYYLGPTTFDSSIEAFKDLFCTVNYKKQSGLKAWINNDWVFVYEFKLHKP